MRSAAQIGRTVREWERPPTRSKRVSWRCKCGHPIYTHGRYKRPNEGSWIYSACGDNDCLCGKYGAEDGSDWPSYR